MYTRVLTLLLHEHEIVLLRPNYWISTTSNLDLRTKRGSESKPNMFLVLRDQILHAHFRLIIACGPSPRHGAVTIKHLRTFLNIFYSLVSSKLSALYFSGLLCSAPKINVFLHYSSLFASSKFSKHILT